jgi:hypothetical protein
VIAWLYHMIYALVFPACTFTVSMCPVNQTCADVTASDIDEEDDARKYYQALSYEREWKVMLQIDDELSEKLLHMPFVRASRCRLKIPRKP